MKKIIVLLIMMLFIFGGCIEARISESDNSTSENVSVNYVSEESVYNDANSSHNDYIYNVSEDTSLYDYEGYVLNELKPLIYSVMLEKDFKSPYYTAMLYNNIDKVFYNPYLDWGEFRSHSNAQLDLWKIELQKAVNDFEYIITKEDFKRVKESTAEWEETMLEMMHLEDCFLQNNQKYADTGALGSLYITDHYIYQYKYMTFKLKYILFTLEEYTLSNKGYEEFKSLQFAYDGNN